MSNDRQQRRFRRRQLVKAGEASLKRGLPPRPSLEAVAGLALVLCDTLADRAHNDRASRAAEIMHGVFEASLKAAPSRLEIACRRGCSYCCHNWVGATAPEIFLLVRALDARPKPGSSADRSAILARATVTAGVGIAERFGRKLPCALLADKACSMYAARPTVCRQVTSTQLEPCIEEFEGKDFDGAIVASKVFLEHAGNCRIPLLAALEASGHASHNYELGAGLKAAVEPGSEMSWLEGVDIFADAARGPVEPEPIRQAIRAVVAEIAHL